MVDPAEAEERSDLGHRRADRSARARDRVSQNSGQPNPTEKHVEGRSLPSFVLLSGQKRREGIREVVKEIPVDRGEQMRESR